MRYLGICAFFFRGKRKKFKLYFTIAKWTGTLTKKNFSIPRENICDFEAGVMVEKRDIGVIDAKLGTHAWNHERFAFCPLSRNQSRVFVRYPHP